MSLSRPTILIAYGDYGNKILKQFLDSSNRRGLLHWGDRDVHTNKINLEKLKIFWLRKPVDDKQNQEIIDKDLLRQIIPINFYDGNAETFKDIVAQSAKELNQRGKPFLLDVFFLASTDSEEIEIYQLDRFIKRAIDKLRDISGNKYYLQSAQVLNIIEILDYESLLENMDQSRALSSSINGWESTGGYGRIYICNGYDENGSHRDQNNRIKETILFLQFLLFEADRQIELKHLYERQVDKPVLASFGIRLGEQKTEVLSRRVAAETSIKWLGYLAGDHFDSDVDADNKITSGQKESEEKLVKTLRALKNIDAKGLSEQVKFNDINKSLDQAVSQIKIDLTGETKKSINSTIKRLESAFEQAELKAIQQVSTELSSIRNGELIKLEQELKTAITADLTNVRYPVPIGILIKAIDEKIKKIKRSEYEKKSSNQLDTDFIKNTLSKYYGDYQHFKLLRVDKQKSRWIWPIVTLVFCLAITPVAHSLVSLLPVNPTYTLLYKSQSALQDYPLLTLLILLMTYGAFYQFLGKKYISNKLDETENWFSNKLQGRLTYALRKVTRNKMLHNKVYADIQHSLQSEVIQLLTQKKSLLEKRKDEMDWLKKKLDDIRKGYSGGTKNSYYTEISHNEDEYRMRNIAKSDEKPRLFKAWQNEYSDTFLSPLHFINKISEGFSYKFQNPEKNTDSTLRDKELLKQISTICTQYSDLPIGVNLPQQEGLSESKRHVYISKDFHSIHGINKVIDDKFAVSQAYSLPESHHSRMYLLSVKLGINKAVLLTKQR